MERNDFKKAAASKSLRADFEAMEKGKHNPFIKDGRVDVDAYITFVTEYNEFINHKPRPFQKIMDKNMVL